MVPLQKELKHLKSDLRKEKKENRNMHRQVQEAHAQVLLQDRRHVVIQTAFRQRDAEVARLRAELSRWVSTPALAPAWSCSHEAEWLTQPLSNPRSCAWQMMFARSCVMQQLSWCSGWAALACELTGICACMRFL